MTANGKRRRTQKTFKAPDSLTLPFRSSSSNRFRESLDDLLTMAEQVRELRTDLARSLGVTEPQYRLIWALAALQGPLGATVTSLARRLRVTGAFVTTEVNKLLKLGLVSKKSNPGDGRSVLVKLTSKGESELELVAIRAQKINDSYFRDMSGPEFEMLGRIVNKLIANGTEALSLLRGTDRVAPGPIALLGGRASGSRRSQQNVRPMEKTTRLSRKERKHV